MSGPADLLRHERVLVGGALGVLVVLAWLYVLDGAGMGMPALEMTDFSLFPHRQTEMGGSMDAPFHIVLAMWWVMMVAMMTPSVAPLVLLYARVLRHHGREGVPNAARIASPWVLLAGYLAVWLMFALVAATLQRLLEPAGLLSPMMLWSRSAALSASLLAAAGIYQLSPLKQACLSRCRAPVTFLTRYWRPGATGAFRLGVIHGAWCVGCCWLLMALLFVGGIMNVAWIAALTLLVMAEKVLPAGPAVGKGVGVLLLAWAAATLWR